MLTLLATALVVCAPGYPGSAAEAQPAMDALAHALSIPAAVTASYEETAEGGLRKLASPDAGLLLATLPFFLEHEHDLHLTARLMAIPRGGQKLQKWTLVTGKEHPEALNGYSVQSLAGSSPRFVHAMAPGLPAEAAVKPSSSVLSGLRKAANGEKIAVLLDGAQAASLKTLPFAAQLATVATSAPVPVAVVATVGKRVKDWSPFAKAFMGVGGDALAGIQMSGFTRLDESALAAARAAWQKAK